MNSLNSLSFTVFFFVFFFTIFEVNSVAKHPSCFLGQCTRDGLTETTFQANLFYPLSCQFRGSNILTYHYPVPKKCCTFCWHCTSTDSGHSNCSRSYWDYDAVHLEQISDGVQSNQQSCKVCLETWLGRSRERLVTFKSTSQQKENISYYKKPFYELPANRNFIERLLKGNITFGLGHISR